MPSPGHPPVAVFDGNLLELSIRVSLYTSLPLTVLETKRPA